MVTKGSFCQNLNYVFDKSYSVLCPIKINVIKNQEYGVIWSMHLIKKLLLQKICKLYRKIMKNKNCMTFRTGKLRIVEESRDLLRKLE